MIRDDDKLLDPDMPGQQLRLHMGEMTAQEMRTARAAIRWANTRASRLPRQEDEIRKAALEEAARAIDALGAANHPVGDYPIYALASIFSEEVRALISKEEGSE